MQFTIFIVTGLLGLATAVQAQTNPPPAREESLAVVVHKDNSVTNLSLVDLRKLCLAEQKHWDNGRKITVVLREPGQPAREAVLRAVYRMKESEFTRYFLQSTFTGEVGTAPKQLATAAGVRRFVFNVPGAIGFVRASELDDSVKPVRIDGLAPGEAGYPLTLPTR